MDNKSLYDYNISDNDEFSISNYAGSSFDSYIFRFINVVPYPEDTSTWWIEEVNSQRQLSIRVNPNGPIGASDVVNESFSLVII